MSSPSSRRGFALPRVLLLAAFVTGPAFAAGWSTFEAAFPAHPCQDGWAGCLTGGGAIGAGMKKDAAGYPISSGARIGWFDLAPTASFSPFVGLSGYTGPIGGQVAVAEPPPPPAPTPDAAPQPDAPPPTADAGSTGPDAATPERIAPTAGTTTASQVTTPTQPVSGTQATTTVATTTTTSTAKTTAPTAPTTPTTSNPDAAMKVVTPPTASTGDACDDLVKIEPVAMMGTLNVGQSKCLEGRISTEGAQTMRDKISRVLINNAEAKGDKAEWERLVKRHLEDIDRSDPDLCYKYALQLSRGGVGRAQGVIRWADYALENKQRWSGNTYTSRVYALYKLKAEAANKVWQDADNEYMTKEHTEANEAKANKWRGVTKDFAREWLDYAKASSQDTKNAMAICVSAAGSKDFCEG